MNKIKNLNINGLEEMEEHFQQILKEEIKKKMMKKM